MDPHLLHMFSGLFVLFPVVLVVMIVVYLIPFWLIWKKAGFSPWLSILMIVPLVGFVMLYVLAFVDWKVVPVSEAAALPPRV